jgi:ABC-2 type transport system ATP-binding protein
MAEKVVEVEKLTRTFGKKTALDTIDFQMEQGLIYGLVGANGAGKTTLIKHLLGLLRAKSGSVKVFGLNPVHNPVPVLKRIGYLSEERELPEWMTIEELMRYTQAYHPNWDMAYAHDLLNTFALDTNKKVKELSKGMRAQTGLVAAVAHRPDLLILDEPSTGLDAVVREDILDAIVRTVTDDGRTVLFSSHLLEEVERMSDNVTMINDGSIALDAPLEEIKRAHQKTNIRFADSQEKAPAIKGALSIDGGGRSWNVIHNGTMDEIRQSAAALGGEVVESHDATLQEIFVARVGRGLKSAAE